MTPSDSTRWHCRSPLSALRGGGQTTNECPPTRLAHGIAAVSASLAGITLWKIDLRCDADPARAASLSNDERDRAGRFAFAADRRRYIASHCALRELLAARQVVEPADITYEIGAHGKPRLANEAALHFNMSHSKDWAIVGVGGGVEFGVDIEVAGPVDNLDALSVMLFTARERQQLAESPTAARDLTFLRGWTRKEACLKAIGSGLSIEAGCVDAGLDPVAHTLGIAAPGGIATVEVQSIDVGSGLVAAVARLLFWKAASAAEVAAS